MLEVGQGFRKRNTGDAADIDEGVEGIGTFAKGQGGADNWRELIGMGRGHDDRVTAFVKA